MGIYPERDTTHTFIYTMRQFNIDDPNLFLGGGKKPENSQEAHMDTVRRCETPKRRSFVNMLAFLNYKPVMFYICIPCTFLQF